MSVPKQYVPVSTISGYSVNNCKAHMTADPVMRYIADNSYRLTPPQQGLLTTTSDHPHCEMLASADQVQLFQNLLKLIGARKVLEIGVYTGYTTMSMAMVLPKGGVVVGCDISKEYANIGRPFWKESEVEDKIDLRLGPAVETLQELIDNGESGTFDFAFIDADKLNYDVYYEKCVQLVRSGGIIVLDNVLWGGDVADPSVQNPYANVMRAINAKIHNDARVDVSLLRVGDGTTLAFKR